jgi:excisionase family DNA binding protein
MTDGQIAAREGIADDWMDLADASDALGFDSDTILRLIHDGDMPAMQIRGKRRTSCRLPRRLVDEAYAAVMSGGQVELREFARQWSARNAVPEAVALCPSVLPQSAGPAAPSTGPGSPSPTAAVPASLRSSPSKKGRLPVMAKPPPVPPPDPVTTCKCCKCYVIYCFCRCCCRSPRRPAQ